MADLTGWLTKQQVAQRLGVATKTVDRHILRGALSARILTRPGQVPIKVIHPGDVERLAEDLAAQRVEMDTTVNAVVVHRDGAAQDGGGNLPALRPQVAALPDLAAAVAKLAAALEGMKAPQVEAPAYIDMDAAVTLTGLKPSTIRAAIKSGEVKRRGRGLLRRADLLAL